MKLKKYAYNMAFACFDCHKSFKRPVDLIKNVPNTMTCPNCAGKAVNLGRHFKPPKATDAKQWQKVVYLYDNGFDFRKLWIPVEGEAGVYKHIPYPKTLADAKQFVETYQQYAMKNTKFE